MVGERSGTFQLVGFSDASKNALGLVFYLWDVESGECSFIAAKGKVLGRELRTKSIPVLELVALAWGAEIALQLFHSLTTAVEPIDIGRIILFSDSMISLSWLRARVHKTVKMERKSVLVNNKVNKIVSLCESSPITFRFVEGSQNPADLTTRIASSYILKKSNYLGGPSSEILLAEGEEVVVSGPLESVQVCMSTVVFSEPIIALDKFSSFQKFARIINYTYGFINRIKRKLHSKDTTKYHNFNVTGNSFVLGKEYLIRKAQEEAFPEVFRFFRGEISKCLPIVTQLNLVLDKRNILRVKSKFKRLDEEAPILLPRNSAITRSIINDFHETMHHAKVYKIMNVLRQQFYLPKAYSTINAIIKDCVLCKKLHGRAMKCNVGDYREFRVNPSRRPFSSIMCDTAGPFIIRKEGGGERKVYILIFTCLFTRAVSLYVCLGLDVESFLHALQLNVLEYGMVQEFVSDNQPSFIAGINHVSDILDDTEIKNYFKMHDIKLLKFQPYPSGASFLGGAVESMVKQVKHVLAAAMNKQKLSLREFEILVAEAKDLINKRPIGFKNMLSSNEVDYEYPFVITPELLLKGYEVPSVNVLPGFGSPDEIKDSDWLPSAPNIFKDFKHLHIARNRIFDLYEQEFFRTLEVQATNLPNRYKKHVQSEIGIGDLVAIKTNLIKPYHYPLGIVTELEFNDLQEINAITIRKANREIIRRHPTDVIILLRSPETNGCSEGTEHPSSSNDTVQELIARPSRRAKSECKHKISNMASSGLV